MATKKELSIDNLKNILKESYSVLKKFNDYNLSDIIEIIEFENYLRQIESKYLDKDNIKKITIKDFNEISDKLNIENLKMEGIFVKSLKLTNIEDEEYEAYIFANNIESGIISLKDKDFHLLKQSILNIVDITDIYSISCNNVLVKDIKSFFIFSKEALGIKSIKNDGLSELRKFLLKDTLDRIKWFEDEKKQRQKAVDNYRDTYYFRDDKGYFNLKPEYKVCMEKEIEANNYLSNGYWEDRGIKTKNIINLIKNKSLQEISFLLEQRRIEEFTKIIESIIDLAGNIIEIENISVGNKGELNFVANCERALVSVKTVGAGGYNIQRFHYRTLVNIKEHKTNLEDVKKNSINKLSEKEIDLLDNTFIPTIKNNILTGALTFTEGFLLQDICSEYYQSIFNWFEWGCNPIESEYYINVLPSLKTKKDVDLIFNKLCKKHYLKKYKDSYGTEIHLGDKVIGINGILGFTEEDYREININHEVPWVYTDII